VRIRHHPGQCLRIIVGDRTPQLFPSGFKRVENRQQIVSICVQYRAPHRNIAGRDSRRVAQARSRQTFEFNNRVNTLNACRERIGDDLRKMTGRCNRAIVIVGAKAHGLRADGRPNPLDEFYGGQSRINARRDRDDATVK
jgi:hypothetical protein